MEFDPAKESLHILCSKQPVGDNFKILGILFGTKFVMHSVVVSIVAEASARIKMLRCVRHFYQKSELIALYKSHVLTFLESSIPAYYHAHPSNLKLLDEVQSDFIESILVSKKDALLIFNLGPLCEARHPNVGSLT